MSRGDRAVVSGNLSNSMRANYEQGVDKVCLCQTPKLEQECDQSAQSTTKRLGQHIGTPISLEFVFASLHGLAGRHQVSMLHYYPVLIYTIQVVGNGLCQREFASYFNIWHGMWWVPNISYLKLEYRSERKGGNRTKKHRQSFIS
jgi:hypothetical protein